MLIYVTRASIPSDSARSIQVCSMAKAFEGLLGNKFLLVSGSNPLFPASSIKNHQSIQFGFNHKSVRYIFFVFWVSYLLLKNKNECYFTRDILLALLISFSGKKVVYEAHNSPSGFIAESAIKICSRFPSFNILAISNSLKNYYSRNYPMLTHAYMYHDCVDLSDFDSLINCSKESLRSELGLPLDRKIIVHTGSLYKGGAELFGLTVSSHPTMIFYHIGGTEEQCSSWRRYYNQNNITNIMFIPRQDRRVALKYQMSADFLFYVTTSNSNMHWCTSPLKIFEYMATNIPIIASNIGSISEILNDKNSFLYDSNNPTSLKETVRYALSSPSQCVKRANQAYNDVANNYTWNRRVNFITSKILNL